MKEIYAIMGCTIVIKPIVGAISPKNLKELSIPLPCHFPLIPPCILPSNTLFFAFMIKRLSFFKLSNSGDVQEVYFSVKGFRRITVNYVRTFKFKLTVTVRNNEIARNIFFPSVTYFAFEMEQFCLQGTKLRSNGSITIE